MRSSTCLIVGAMVISKVDAITISKTGINVHNAISNAESSGQWPIVGAGYCAQYKELPRNLGLAGCFASAARDMQCVNKHHISYGKGSRSGRCLCDTSLWCTSMEGLGLGNSGYDRYIFAR